MHTKIASRGPLWVAAAALCLLATWLPRQAFAEPAAAADSFSRAGGRQPVSDRALAAVRGGFEAPDAALQLTVGVQRQVWVDGQAVAASTLQFCGPSCASGDATSALALVQRGGGNGSGNGSGAAVSGPLSAAASQGLVVQNTLDQQRLQALTTIDVRSNSLQLFQGAALQAALGGALAASARR